MRRSGVRFLFPAPIQQRKARYPFGSALFSLVVFFAIYRLFTDCGTGFLRFGGWRRSWRDGLKTGGRLGVGLVRRQRMVIFLVIGGVFFTPTPRVFLLRAPEGSSETLQRHSVAQMRKTLIWCAPNPYASSKPRQGPRMRAGRPTIVQHPKASQRAF